MTRAEPNLYREAYALAEKQEQESARLNWRGATDYIISRLGLVLLVLWSTWATWTCSVQSHDNEQLKAIVAQREAAYSQLQQQAQAVVSQLQGEIKQLKGNNP